jgi:hypothetical protein
MECWAWPPRHDDRYLPPLDQEYWFPQRETMDPQEREAAILARIQQVMAYAYDRSPFYRRKWREAGLELGDVKSLDDFERVPVVMKEELRAEQAANPPYLCRDARAKRGVRVDAVGVAGGDPWLLAERRRRCSVTPWVARGAERVSLDRRRGGATGRGVRAGAQPYLGPRPGVAPGRRHDG